MATSAVIEGCKEAGLAPGEGVRAALDGPEQIALLLDEDAKLIDGQFGRAAIGWKGGRQPGAKNRATRDVIEYVRRAGTDPLLWMSKVASMSIDDLKAWGSFEKGENAAEYQRKVVKDYVDILYPGRTIADLLKDALGDTGALTVFGFMALAAARPGDMGAARPDIRGGASADELPSRAPIKDEEKQGDNGGDHA